MEVAANVAEPEWRGFLDGAQGASIFQSPELFRVYGEARGYRPHTLGAYVRKDLCGLLASVVVSHARRPLRALASQSIVIGGPLGDPATFGVLLNAHDQAASQVSALTQIRNLSAPQNRDAFSRAGYRWEDHLNFLLDLQRGEAAVLEGMSKARRKGIASAEGAGLENVALSENDVSSAYRLLASTYRRARIPLADESLFRAAVGQLAPRGLLWALAAALDGELIAVRFVLRWGNSLYDWYAGSSTSGRGLHADEWLVWQVLRRGISSGCTSFDFGGAGRPGDAYGPGEFKRRFGGTSINPGRFEKVYRPLGHRVALSSYRLVRRFPWAPP